MSLTCLSWMFLQLPVVMLHPRHVCLESPLYPLILLLSLHLPKLPMSPSASCFSFPSQVEAASVQHGEAFETALAMASSQRNAG